MEVAKLVLEYLRVVLSWPVITLALGGAFLWFFREEIKAALNRIAGFRFGDKELLMTQATNNVLAAAAPQPPEATPALPAANGPDTEERVSTERERALLWEYRFLNYFLVPRTQLILDWLASRPAMSVHTYDSWLMGSVPNPTERIAVLNALRNHHLVDVRDNDHMIVVNPKGREYIQWRGPALEFLRLGASPSAQVIPPPPAAEAVVAPAAAALPAAPEPANANAPVVGV
jgi:hypothetical protein